MRRQGELRAADAPLVRQVVVEGWVQDAVTGAPLHPIARLDWRREGVEEPFAPFPGGIVTHRGGFAAHLAVRRLPLPAEARRLRATVEAPERVAGTAELVVPADAWTLDEAEVPTSAGPLTYKRLREPVAVFEIALAPRPVRLVGFVLADGDAGEPAGGARLALLDGDAEAGPAAVAGPDGAFCFDALPPAPVLQFRIDLDDLSAVVTHVPDFGVRENRALFTLPTAGE
jgi:hypothetical protein